MADTALDDLLDFREVSESNFKGIHNSVGKVGYSDGVLSGRNSAFQESFDRGYVDGIKAGFEIGKKTFVNDVIRNGKIKNTKLLKEEIEFTDNTVQIAKDSRHYPLVDMKHD